MFDDGFSLKPKHVASNKIGKNVVAVDGLYVPFIFHASQRDIIDGEFGITFKILQNLFLKFPYFHGCESSQFSLLPSTLVLKSRNENHAEHIQL